MRIKDKVAQTSMSLEEYEAKKKTRIHRFLILSCAFFAVITTISFLFFTSCNSDDSCSTNYFNLLNVVIICLGGIGLGYCFIILKDFNHTVDEKMIPHYKKILLDDELDHDDKLSFENKKDDKNLLSLF